MAEKGGTKILAIITICVMLVSIGLSGCIGDDDNDKKEEDYPSNQLDNIIEECQYNYSILIDTDSLNKYNLKVPLPVYSEDNRKINISKINDGLKIINGTVSFEIIDFSQNPYLNINGSGKIEINVNGNDLNKFLVNGKFTNLFLSLADDKNNDGYYDDEYGEITYNIYCQENISLIIRIMMNYHHYNGPGTFLASEILIQSDIFQGWNKVNGSFKTVIG